MARFTGPVGPAGADGFGSDKQIYYNRDLVALENVTTQQSFLGLTDGVAVEGNTRYAYNIRFRVRASADSINLFYAVVGSAEFSNHQFDFNVGRGAYEPAFSPVTKGWITAETDGQTRSSTHISYGEIGGTYWKVDLKGTIDVVTSGYMKPVVQFSPTPVEASTLDGAYMEIYPIGVGGLTDTVIGDWN